MTYPFWVPHYTLWSRDFPRAVVTCVQQDTWGGGVRGPSSGKNFQFYVAETPIFKSLASSFNTKKASKAFNLRSNWRTCVPGRKKPSVGKTLWSTVKAEFLIPLVYHDLANQWLKEKSWMETAKLWWKKFCGHSSSMPIAIRADSNHTAPVRLAYQNHCDVFTQRNPI